MRKSRHQKTSGQGLDSLVDIVSNTVGILIILAVFMALVAQMDLPGSGSHEEAPLEICNGFDGSSAFQPQ